MNTSSSNKSSRRNGSRNNRRQTDPRQMVARSSLRTTLVYNSQFHYVSSTATNNYVVYRGNSCFDPEHSVGGHQPLGYDQLAALYTKTNVHGSRIEVTAYNEADASGGSLTNIGRTIAVAAYPTIKVSPVSSAIDNNFEQPFVQHTILGPPLSASSIRTLRTSHCTTSQVYGQPANDSDFKSLVNANPAKEWYWIIFFRTLDASPCNIRLNIKMYYDVTFFGRPILSSS